MQRYSELQKEKRIKFLIKSVITLSVILFVVLCGVLTTFLSNNKQTSIEVAKTIENAVVKSSEVSLVMVGDNLLHTPIIKNGKQEDGTYNFDSLYAELKPYFTDADISVIVQETVLGGMELGFSGYPLFNSPQEVGTAIKNAGFDIVLHATNHTLDKGSKGVFNTIEFWKQHPEVTVLGINETQEIEDSIKYYEKNDIKFALLNYTDSTNGILLPYDKKYLVNKLDEKKLVSDLITAEENADFTIVFMHWGIEYHFEESPEQTRLATLMCENGADLIMGSHPHVIQPVKWINAENGNSALVFYSLGNYVSRQKEANNLLGILANVKICSHGDDVYIKESSVMPTVTHYNKNSRDFRVYPLKEYTNDLANLHGVSQYDGKVSVERFRAIFEKVFKDNTFVILDY